MVLDKLSKAYPVELHARTIPRSPTVKKNMGGEAEFIIFPFEICEVMQDRKSLSLGITQTDSRASYVGIVALKL